MPIAVFARGVAYAVPIAVAAWYGAGGVADAFFYAQIVPSFVMVIVANAFGAVAVPAFAEIHATRPAGLPAAVGTSAVIAAASALVTGALTAGTLTLLLPHISAFDEPQQARVARFLVALLPYTALLGAGVILRATCEVRKRFVPAALAPAIRGGLALAVVAALRGPLGPDALPAGLALGQAAEVLWYAVLLARDGLVPRLGPLDPRVKQALYDLGAVLGGEVLVAANLVVDKGFAATLPAGSVAWLEYADRARFIPQTLAESTLFPVAYATWAALHATGDRARFAASVDRSLRWMASVSAPPLAGLYVGRLVLVRWLYERGAFGPEDAARSAEVLGWYVPGLWPMFLGALAMKANLLERRLALVFGLGVVSVACNAALDAVLVRSQGLVGVAIASTLIWLVVPAVYLGALWPTLRDVADARAWSLTLLVAAASLGIALFVEVAHGPPASLTDPWLWAAAVPCAALLGLANHLRSSSCAS